MQLLLIGAALLLVLLFARAVQLAAQWVVVRRAAPVWREVSTRLELTPGPHGRLEGRSRGIALRVSPRGARAELRVAVPAPLPAGLNLFAESRRPRLQLRALQDIRVGDAAFDAAVVVQGRNPAEVIRVMRGEGVQPALMRFFADHPSGRLTGNELVLPGVGAEELPAAVGTLVGLSLALGKIGEARREAIAAATEGAAREPRPSGAAKLQGFTAGAPEAAAPPYFAEYPAPEPPEPPDVAAGEALEPPYDQWLIEEWSRRRRRAGRWGLGALVAFFVFIGSLFAAFGTRRPSDPALYTLLLSMFATPFLIFLAEMDLVCPACDYSPSGRNKRPISDSCPSCGVRLRD